MNECGGPVPRITSAHPFAVSLLSPGRSHNREAVANTARQILVILLRGCYRRLREESGRAQSSRGGGFAVAVDMCFTDGSRSARLRLVGGVRRTARHMTLPRPRQEHHRLPWDDEGTSDLEPRTCICLV